MKGETALRITLLILCAALLVFWYLLASIGYRELP
jgi:hypothetical protein